MCVPEPLTYWCFTVTVSITETSEAKISQFCVTDLEITIGTEAATHLTACQPGLPRQYQVKQLQSQTEEECEGSIACLTEVEPYICVTGLV